MASPQVQFRAIEPLDDDLAARQSEGGFDSHSLGDVAQRDLRRYYSLLTLELSRVPLTEAQACLLVDALNGTLYTSGMFGVLHFEIEDACRLDGADEKWDVNASEIVALLKALTPAQELAVWDACERFWAGDHQDLRQGLRRVGLIR